MSNPRGITPNRDTGLRLNPQPSTSLIEGLSEVVDDARQILVDLGLRPYEVFSVIVRWTGGSRHRGTPQVLSETPILPVPEVRDIGSVDRAARSGGVVQRGSVRLEKISSRYTEDDILLLFPRALAPGEEHYIEVRTDSRDGSTQRDRYVVSGKPQRHATRFEWTVRCTKQDENRTRLGVPQ